mmetsp:Transcript_15763/g.45043  ORF Transcript_15763/g.45043 Transcript_15763/m.45043 type:complete len:191 (+) Transcript_15763:94-666(+)
MGCCFSGFLRQPQQERLQSTLLIQEPFVAEGSSRGIARGRTRPGQGHHHQNHQHDMTSLGARAIQVDLERERESSLVVTEGSRLLGRTHLDSSVSTQDEGEEDAIRFEKEAALKRFRAAHKEEECPICLEPFDDDNPAVFLNCGHAFHLHCTYEWLERSSVCAVCQTQVETYDEGGGGDSREDEGTVETP